MRRSRKARLVAEYAAVSSQLNILRARVVSTWRTTSLSKVSLSVMFLTWFRLHASRWGSGIEAVNQFPLALGIESSFLCKLTHFQKGKKRTEDALSSG